MRHTLSLQRVRWRTVGAMRPGYSLRERPILKKPLAYEDLSRVLFHLPFPVTWSHGDGCFDRP